MLKLRSLAIAKFDAKLQRLRSSLRKLFLARTVRAIVKAVFIPFA